MNAQELTLNIAVNLGRLARWVADGKTKRVDMFLDETHDYITELGNSEKSKRFIPTFHAFREEFEVLQKSKDLNDDWAEEMLTWANILMHRAKLA